MNASGTLPYTRPIPIASPAPIDSWTWPPDLPYIVGLLIVVAAAWGVAFFSPSAPARRITRARMLSMALAASAATGFCLIYPFFTSAAGVLIIPAMLLGLLAWLLFSVWSWLNEREAYLALSRGDRIAADKRGLAEGFEDIELRLAKDRAVVRRFFITPQRRSRLRRQIPEQELLLQGMIAMEKGYDEHLRKDDAAP